MVFCGIARLRPYRSYDKLNHNPSSIFARTPMVITHHVIEYTSPPGKTGKYPRDITRDITQFSNLTSGRIKAIVSNVIQDG